MNKFLIIFVSLFIIFSATAKSEPKTYILGVEDIDYFPYEKTVGGKWENSFSKELLDAFAKALGYRFIYKPMPITTLYADFLTNDVDFKFPDNPQWQVNLRAGENIKYSNPVIPYTDGFFVLPKNLDKTHIKSLGIINGFTPWGFVSEIETKKIKIFESTNIDDLIKAVVNNKIDGIYCNHAVIRNFLTKNKKYKSDIIVINKKLPYIESSYYLSTIKYPNVLNEFNQFLKNNPDFIRNLKERYNLNKSTNE